MAHVPHVYIARPWGDGPLTVRPEVNHHLVRVLRREPQSAVTYTDGKGTLGEGTLSGGTIERGVESLRERNRVLTVAVAPLHRMERARFLVEKLAELGVGRLVWLTTRFTNGRAPRPDKAASWAVSALEQSGGAHLMEIEGPSTWENLDSSASLIVAAHGGGTIDSAVPANRDITVVIGPEGGLAADETPRDALLLGLGETILRTETAAVVAAGIVLDRWRRVE